MNTQAHIDAQDTLGSFVCFDDAEAAPMLPIVDRSTLERFANCPAQGRLLDVHHINDSSTIASVGEEVHRAFGAAIDEYILSRGGMSPTDIGQSAWQALYGSRPDLQPQVIQAARASIYGWSKYVGSLHHDNILRWDGGKGERSGQLAFDMPDLSLRITTEVDLLHATPSKELLAEIDYKSGHKLHSALSVAESFQFCVHGWLILKNYPEVNAVLIRVWNTRSNRLTWPVEFTREKLNEYHARIRSAAQVYLKWRDALPETVETWPTVEKCELCPVAQFCPESGENIVTVKENPGGYVDSMVALAARLSDMERAAAAHVKQTKKEIVSSLGNCFGFAKPKATRATPAKLYSLPKEDEDEAEETGEA